MVRLSSLYALKKKTAKIDLVISLHILFLSVSSFFKLIKYVLIALEEKKFAKQKKMKERGRKKKR